MKKTPKQGAAGKKPGKGAASAVDPVKAVRPPGKRPGKHPRVDRRKKLPPSKRGGPLPRWWAPLMTEVANNGGWAEVAKESIGISRKTPESYIARHPEFKERYYAELEEARQIAGERTLAEGYRRGVKGYEEAIVYQGNVAEKTITKYSDTLLIFTANARGMGTRQPAQVHFNFGADSMRDMPADLLERLVAGDDLAEVVGAWRARQEAEKNLEKLPEKT